MSFKENRIAIIRLFDAGKTASNIIKDLNLPRQTVYDAIKRYKELGTTQDKPRSGRPRTATTPANLNKLRLRISRNPRKSMRKLAKEIGRASCRVRV